MGTDGAKACSLLSVVFAGLLAGVTCSVHAVILLVGRHAASSGLAGMPLFFSFAYPSVPYAPDILAWDVFFALAVLFAAPAFKGDGLAKWIRAFLATSGILALAGLCGVEGDMQLRAIGIVGLRRRLSSRAGPHGDPVPSRHTASGLTKSVG